VSLKKEFSQTPSSRKIGSTFGLKAQGYDQFTPFQSLLISELVECSSPIHSQLRTVADLGCGSGYFAKCSRDHSQQYTVIGLDIALASLKLAKPRNTTTIQGDINALPFKASSFDAVVAASVLQWISDIDNCITVVHDILKPDGYFLFAVFTEQSFCELNTAKQDLGIPVPVNLHNGLDFIVDLNSKQFNVCMSQTICQTFYFKTARDALKSISNYGATAMASEPLNRTMIKELCARYEHKFVSEKGVPLTYSAIIGYAQKGDVS